MKTWLVMVRGVTGEWHFHFEAETREQVEHACKDAKIPVIEIGELIETVTGELRVH